MHHTFQILRRSYTYMMKMSNFWNKADNFVGGVLLIGCMPSFVILVVIIGLFRSCMGYGEIDIDNSYMTRRYMYDRIYIADSTGCGYELLYYTTNAVTEARYDEIKSRQHIRDSYKELQASAPEYFNHDLINTNIYDFVDYAKRFDIDSADVRLVNIFVYGKKYEDLYRRPHPDYPDGVHFMDDLDELGILYLKEDDIFPCNYPRLQTYRYWGCDASSSTDERYTHITKSDRLQRK